ncbi:MAG: glucosamine--fructose-6-phosphate aminotransferase (isomerizing), partial [Parcubacteria group bacterium Gr01-1014_72]
MLNKDDADTFAFLSNIFAQKRLLYSLDKFPKEVSLRLPGDFNRQNALAAITAAEAIGIPVEVDLASEFRYRKPVFREGDVMLSISQSGETADTLAAIREAKEKGVLTLGIVNVVGSTIARDTDAGVYQHIG